MLEATATPLVLAAVGALAIVSVLGSRASSRIGVPVALLFLVIGMLAGSDGLGGIAFDDHALAFRLGTAALVLILFDGGLNTSLGLLRRNLAPAALLATLGVLGTAAGVAVAARALGFGWLEAMLLGVIVSSTDAAAVFSVLRGSGIRLRARASATLELESGLNDPLAVILTLALTGALSGEGALGWSLVPEALAQLGIGLLFGLAFGYAGRALLRIMQVPAAGLYPALTVGMAFAAYGVPALFLGSGFLAVYVAGMLLGNSALPYRGGLFHAHDALAWLSQIGMFLLLGLLVFPSRLVEVLGTGLVLAGVLVFLARPVVVLLCLLPLGYTLREASYIGWVGLRGAVPIILSMLPVMAGAPGGETVFDTVFVIVVVTALVPGGTVKWFTRWLRMESEAPPPPRAALEILSARSLSERLVSFYVQEASAVAGNPLRDIPMPEQAAVVLIVRGEELLVPRGHTTLHAGDHVYVFCKPEDLALVQLLFGRREEH